MANCAITGRYLVVVAMVADQRSLIYFTGKNISNFGDTSMKKYT